MTAQEAVANIEDQNRSAARLGLERIRPLPAQAPAEAVQTGSCSAYRTRLRECSEEVPPEEIDLVVCPCTVFDESCNRMGMGGGFYDRYLPKCVRAKIVSVAFELQKAPAVPMEQWDRAVDMTFTEESVYQTI